MNKTESFSFLLFSIGGGWGVLFLFSVISNSHTLVVWFLALFATAFILAAYELGIPDKLN